MKPFSIVVFFFVILSAAAQNRNEWFEFYLPWDDSSKTVTDMSHFLDAPAGKHGFLQVTPDGHFRFENKVETERFVGVVNVAISNFPTKEQAQIIAARMAKFGINLVRIHLIDVEGQYGLFQNSANNTRTLHPARLDQMDYFIKCLKDRGIYFNFCIHAGRMYKTNDGIDAPVTNNQSKYVTLFNQKLIDLQKEFAQQTIGHVNPYTGLSYADDPAMATVELTNENSLFNGWFGWNSDYIFAEKAEGIGSFYSNELDTKFNTWLEQKYKTDDSLRISWAGNEIHTPEELIKNGSFEQSFTNWGKFVHQSGSEASISIDNTEAVHGSNSAKIVVTSPGSEYWHVHLKTNQFRIEKNKAYKIGFYAKADAKRTMRLEIMENQTWKWVSGPFIELSDTWVFHEIYFNTTFSSNTMIVQFEYGKNTGTFWLDSVSITETSGIGLEPGESLEASTVKRSKSTQIGKHSKKRVADNAAFYFELEKKYTSQLTNYLVNTLGVKCPVTFTNNYFGLASLFSQAQADYIDFHMYWDHPNFPNGWSETDFTLKNKSMLLNPAESTINRMLLGKVKNKPFLLSEYNHAYPYIFQLEAPSLLYAYGSFFDVDGIVWHAYYDYMNRFTQRYQDMFFDIAMHPVMMTQMLLALPYRMRYIKKAETWPEISYKKEDIFNNTKIYQDAGVLNMEGKEHGTAFLNHGFQHADFEADSTFLFGEIATTGATVSSETNELYWNGDAGYFTVNSPFWQGATGYLGNKTIQLSDIGFTDIKTSDNLNFASIHLISLDSLPLAKSKRMILLTSARLENEGLLWNDEKTSLLSKGGTRALCEPVEAMVVLNNTNTDSCMVYKLNELGKRTDSLMLNQFGSNTRFILNKKTLWYEISNHKARSIPQAKQKTENSKSFLNVYPNPGKQYARVDFSFPGITEMNFVLYNSEGKLIQQKKMHAANRNIQQLRVDLSNLKNGLYFCGFEFSTGKRIIEKLMVTE